MAHLAEVLQSLTADDPKTVVQGRRFERLIEGALRAHPGEYGRERFEEVWLWGEWPEREALGYGRDMGIDIVARQTPAYGGGWCAIQCKFHQSEVPTAGVDSFLGASGTADFSSRLLIATARVSGTGMAKVRKAEPRCEVLHTSEMDRWVEDWREFADTPDRLEIPPAPKHKLHGFQQDAVRDITKSFRDADRGQLILPCGTGKSLVALRAAEQVAGKGGRVLYLVPSIALIGQTMREWSRQREMPLRYLGVCSDVTAGRKASAQADTAGDLTELAIPVTTDPERLADELSLPAPPDAMQVVFSTYQSSPKIAEAQERAGGGWGFDLIICDEAHRTTGIEESKEGLGVSPFRIVHDDKHIRGRKRLYMTATPRVFTERQKKKIEGPDFEGDSYSMADAKTFGERFYEMEFSEAVEGGYLSDYEVLVITATEEAYLQSLVNAGWSHELLVQEGTDIALDDAVKLAGCWDALATPATTEVKHWRLPGQIYAGLGAPAHSAIAFTNRVYTSETVAEFWPQQVNALTSQRSKAVRNGKDSAHETRVFLGLDVDHIDGSTPAAERTDLLEKLRGKKWEVPQTTEESPTCRIISNARVLTEGVDVPSLDAVIFLNSRTSTVDITQAVGRAMRTAPGKDKGYIVIPVVVPQDASPQKMLEASDFKTVWEVVRALRSHDSRMEHYVSNASAWKKNAPLRARIFGPGGEIDEAEEQIQLQLHLQLSQEIASMVVDTIGDKQMYPRWGSAAADICRQVQTLINHLIAKDGPAQKSFARFLKGIRHSVGYHVKTDQAQEMIAQHVVTIRVFEVMLGDSSFAEQNPVSREIERLLETFRQMGVSFEEELRPLTRAYRQMEAAFQGAVTSAEKVDILREIYEGFFQAAMKETVKRVGIVYTPVKIVDFMVRSASTICQKEFGRSIGSESLHILDPFAGTGTFLARLIEMKDKGGNYLISTEDLDRKYKQELHSNEFILLAYYIAAIKIEEAKHSRDSKSFGEVKYETYKNIVLSDTLLASPEQEEFDVLRDNIRGRQEQDDTPMTVILANPPWSAGQKSTGDDNPNIEYPAISERVSQTYGVKHREITGRGIGKAAGNLYVKALRWCSDRILPNEERGNRPAIVGLVHPNSLTDGTSLVGARAKMREEFTDIYVVNLRGNAYKSGDERQREGDPVFGGGTRNGVQITFLVRNPAKEIDQPANLYYVQVPDYLDIKQKFEWLEEMGDVTNSEFVTVPVTPKHDWVDLSDGTFEEMLSVCNTDKNNSNTAVRSHALGVTAACDVYLYSFSRKKLIDKVRRYIDAYDVALDYMEDYPDKKIEDVTANTRLDVIKWTGKLKSTLRQRQRIVYDESRIREVLYRPFTKLWLYEDDRILASVKTVSDMFPRNEDLRAITGGGVGEFSSPVHPTWQSSESSQPGYTEISKPQGPPKPPESLPEGDSDQQRQQHDIPGTGHGVSPGPGGDQGLPADAGDAAPGITGGGVGDSRYLSIEQGTLRNSRYRGHLRPLRSGDPTGQSGPSPEAMMLTGPSNMARFGVLAGSWLADLHTMAAGQQTRVIPRR